MTFVHKSLNKTVRGVDLGDSIRIVRHEYSVDPCGQEVHWNTAVA